MSPTVPSAAPSAVQTVAQIHQLSEGFILDLGETTVACTNLDGLLRAVRRHLPRGKLVPFPARAASPAGHPSHPSRPSPTEVRAALATPPAPPASPPGPAAPTAPKPLAQLAAALPPDQMGHLVNIADAVYTGRLSRPDDITFNLSKYVPALSPEGWNLFIAEYVADRRADEE